MVEYIIKTKGSVLTAAELAEAQEFIAVSGAKDWASINPSINIRMSLDLTKSPEGEASESPVPEAASLAGSGLEE